MCKQIESESRGIQLEGIKIQWTNLRRQGGGFGGDRRGDKEGGYGGC